jgi:hypothetical protein
MYDGLQRSGERPTTRGEEGEGDMVSSREVVMVKTMRYEIRGR